MEDDTPEFVDLSVESIPGMPSFTSARLIPARALMLLHARARLTNGKEIDVIWAPEPGAAMAAFDGGADDFMGNASFSFGAIVLAPYANRVRGRYLPEDHSIETRVGDRIIRLPANGGGKKPNAEKYAIHGLILQDRAEVLYRDETHVSGLIRAGDFGHGWPSKTELTVQWGLTPTELSLRVRAQNVGTEDLPIGLGWHPYFAIPSGERAQAQMRLPARSRIVVNNYDEVLPTGELCPVVDTRFDFRAEGGRPLGPDDLDDCFVDLDKDDCGSTVCELTDPAARYGLRISSPSPEISAIQTFTDITRPFVVIEPQFNWANPFGNEWGPNPRTGMVMLKPGTCVEYCVNLQLFDPPHGAK
jgi:galactose mutarotase-like enzyme